MQTTPDIWIAFLRTFSVLFVVLAFLLLIFYFIRRMSEARGLKNSKTHIRVLGMHHFSPKEKLAIVDVLGKTFLIGITPNQISKLSDMGSDMELDLQPEKKMMPFSKFLSEKLGRVSMQKVSREKQ